MKKIVHFAWMTAIMMGLGMTTVACSDDDDDKKSNEESQAEKQAMDPYEKNTAEGIALYNILGQLAGTDSLPDNWKTATFEPTVGTVLDESNPFVRTIPVNSVKEAAKMYQSLTATTLKEGATTANWQLDGVGTLTYEAQNQSNLFATIDISVKQLPKLTQLRFVPEDAIGTNGVMGLGNYTFEGDPYYHIGDVVRDKDGRYWICVRSAWSGKKGDTHWISFQLLTKKSTNGTGFANNFQTYKATKNRGVHVVPTNLGSSPEKLGYLAQLMAVLTTDDEKELLTYFTGDGPLKDGLGDLGFDAHSTVFCQNLGNAWDINNVWSKILPGYINEKGEMVKGNLTKDYFDIDNYNSLNFFYSGYSSPIWTSNMELYVCENKGNAFSRQELSTWEWNMDSQASGIPNTFDVRDFILNGSSGNNTNINISLQGGSGGTSNRVVPVVYTTGKGLTKTFTEPDPTKKFETCDDVFLASRDMTMEDLSEKTPSVGYVLCSNCKFYKNAGDARLSGATPVGIVATGGKSIVEDQSIYNFLVMGMEDLEKQYAWSGSTYTSGKCCIQNPNYLDEKHDAMNGIAFTTMMKEKQCGTDHSHPAATAAIEYRNKMGMSLTTMRQNNMSDWFVPSDGQWVMALTELVGCDLKDVDTFETNVDDLHNNFNMRGITPLHGIYWTSTSNEEEPNYAVTLEFDRQYPQFFTASTNNNEKVQSHKVRPFLAFYYKK